MSSDPKNYFGFTFDEFSELVVYWFDITDSEHCDALHELGKFVLSKTEIIFRIAWHF